MSYAQVHHVGNDYFKYELPVCIGTLCRYEDKHSLCSVYTYQFYNNDEYIC